MFILKQWTVLHMSDWVEEAIVVSETKQRLVEYHEQHGGRRMRPSPLIDQTEGESLEQFCRDRKISEHCIDCYWTIETIECLR